MSIHAISWALKLDMKRSSEKFVLVCMCNYADEAGYCYPSIAALVADTSQNRKTVMANLRALSESGLIQDSGRRVGSTGQTIVYQIVGYLRSTEKGPVETNSTENGTVNNGDLRASGPEVGTIAAENEKKNSTENGPIKESQKRDSLETVPKTVPVPKTAGKSPVFSTKESQKRYSEPSGTVREPSLDSRRAASGGSKTSSVRDPAGEKAPDESTLDAALYVEARKVFGRSIGGQINRAIRLKGDSWRSWLTGLIETCRGKDPEGARAYFAAALKGAEPKNGANHGHVFP